MRRLPIFFLIDVSESMVGDPIANVNKGMHQIISKLKGNPMALETAFISVILFAGEAKELSPLTELLQFHCPDLFIGGGTALGTGLNFLMERMEKQVQKTTLEQKGDWKPLVFLFTDGTPTDDVSSAISRWNSEFRNKSNLVAVSIGNQADTSVLNKITDNVIIFDSESPEAYTKFFEWVSASIEMKSASIATGSEEFELPKVDQKILRKEDVYRSPTGRDERYVILLSRCQTSKKPYLVKYLKESESSYIPEGAYLITEEYFSLTSDGEGSTISAEMIKVIPPCPECNNQGLAYCACGNLFCIGHDGRNTCPWCSNEVIVEYSGGFDVSKTQG